MLSVTLPLVEGDQITSDLFGGNFLADRYTLGGKDGIEAAIDRLGVSGLRYPGGSLTERLFDIRNPDSATAVDDDGSIVDFVPLSDFLAYAAEADQPVTIVIPTRDFLSRDSDANGNRFPAFDDDELREFVRDVAQGEYGNAEIAAFEIGNEYWGSGEMTAVEYGRLSSRMAEVIDDELDKIAQETGTPPGIEIVVQTGTNFGYSDLRTQYEGQTRADILDDLNSKYGTDFGTEVVFPQGGLNWRMINDELVQKEFNASEMDAIDGVVTHLYSKDPVQPGQREFGLDTIQQTWIEDNPDLDIYVTEWNQSAAEPRFDSEEDFGLVKAHEVLNTFETMVGAGVDQAHIWPLLQNTRNALQPDSMDGELSPTGALFSMMSDALPGKQMLDFAVNERDVTEFQGRTADLHGFYGDGEMVLYLVSTSDQTETHGFDLSTMIASGGDVSATLLGVEPGDEPGSVKATARTENLSEDDFYEDGQVAVALDPGGILEIRIANFVPTKGFASATEGNRSAQEAPSETTAEPLPLLPIEERDDAPDADGSSDDEAGDDGLMDGIAWLLGLLPLLALGGMAG